MYTFWQWVNSSRAEPKMLLSAQCQYPKNRNRMKKSKIAARLKSEVIISFHFIHIVVTQIK